MHSPEAARVAARLGLRPGRANIDVFAGTLLALARADRNILAVTSDSRGSGKLVPFGDALPAQLIEVGIAEQNLVGIAAGLASCGKKPFAVSPACFLTARALEQVKNDAAYSDNPVVLVGISAGVSYGALGTTHHSLHDFAALRAINNLTIMAPADNFETCGAVRHAASAAHPVYLRFGKAPLCDISNPAEPFVAGKARVLCDGADAALIATGETVIHARLAAAYLRETAGIACRVLSVPAIKPLDAPAILDAARECRALVTVEEHMVSGGLGEACAALVAQSPHHPRMRLLGIPDERTVTGSQAEIFRHYGLTMEGVAAAVHSLLF
jgi:transketolase